MNNKISENSNYTALIIFAVAMGFLEAIVVVYVRELYYPEGFEFPLKELPPKIILIELIRELTTMLMLGSVAWITGKFFLKRLSVFLLLFGIWDIFYYVALKIFLNWPESLFTWDILFLIPIAWVGPVLAPVICSLVMIFMALTFDWFYKERKLMKLRWKELLLIFSGAAIILYTFVYDFGKIILEGNFLKDFFTLAENPVFLKVLTSYEPMHYQWGIFTIGMAIIILGNIFIIQRGLSEK